MRIAEVIGEDANKFSKSWCRAAALFAVFPGCETNLLTAVNNT